MRQETVDIVGELVGRMQPTINIDSIIDNGNSTYTIMTSNTSYVAPGTTLTIGGNEYVVLSDNSFVFNEQFTVSGSVDPSGITEIILDVLHYKHGTAMATNSELSRIQLGVDKYPLVYLLEVIEDDFNNDENLRLDRTSDLRLFFLSETKEESWTTDQHYEYSIKPMRNMAYDFIKFLNKITLIGEFDTYKIFNYAKFGVYTPQKGSISRIFNDKLSGAELRINLPILKTNKCSNDKEISVVCESGKITNSDETFVDFVMSGGTKVLPDTKVTDSDGQVYYQPSVNDVVCTPGGGTADVTNSDGSYNETVNAGNTLVVDDSEISINGNLLKSLPATNDLDINLINTDGDVVENFTILPSGDVELDEFRVANSDDSFEEYYAINDNGAILNDIDNVDTDGTVVPTPAQIPFTCSAPDNTILNLNFLDTASTVEFKGDSLNAGIYRADACGLDSTEISVSTDDGTTFTPLSFPFTIVDGVDYIFMRSVSDITNQFNSFRIIPNLNSYDSVSSIAQRGLILDLDGRNTASYNGIGTVWTDVVSGHTFDLINSPAFVNKCFVFNGVDNYAPANPDDFEIDETQPFTINAVVNIDDVSFGSRLATLGTFKTASYDQAIKIFYSEISTFRGINFCINNGFTFRTNVNLTKGVNNLIQIKYLGGSITSSFSYELRVNNVLVPATTSSLTYKAGNTTIIGADDRLTSNTVFDGNICRVFVNEVETTTAEDLFNYNLLDTVYNFGV